MYNDQFEQQETPTMSSDSSERVVIPRIVLGVVCGVILVGCVFGVHALVSSSMEKAQLAASGASGSEYLGTIVIDVLGIALLVPAIPSILLTVFVVRPTRSTFAAAVVGVILWWVLWVFAGVILLPLSMTDIDLNELLYLILVFLIIAVPPAVSTLCVWLASRGIGCDEIKGGTE